MRNSLGNSNCWCIGISIAQLMQLFLYYFVVSNNTWLYLSLFTSYNMLIPFCMKISTSFEPAEVPTAAIKNSNPI